MKKLLTALTLLSLSFTATAEDEKMTCKQVSELAGVIMTARQTGVPMVEVFEKADGFKVIEDVIILAYKTPKFSVKENQQEQINEFKNEFFLNCVK